MLVSCLAAVTICLTSCNTTRRSAEDQSILVVRGGHAHATPAFEDMCREVSELEYDLLLTVHVERMEAEEITGKYAALLFLDQNKHYPTTKWNRKRYMDLAQLGVGMVFLQFTLSSEPEWDSYHDLVGGKWFLKRYEANAMLHSTYFYRPDAGCKDPGA